MSRYRTHSIAFVIVLSVAIAIWVATRNDVSPTQTVPDIGGPTTANCDSTFERVGQTTRATDSEGEIHRSVDERGFFVWPESESPASLLSCLRPFETVIVVEGLPQVSGVYRSRDVNMELHGFGGGMDTWSTGRCFVAGSDDGLTPFQTNAVVSGLGDRVSGEVENDIGELEPVLEQVGVSVTIDVGVSIGLGDPDGPQPFIGLNVFAANRGDAEGAPPERFITHNYVAAVPDGNATIHVDAQQRPSEDNDWAGLASFTSTFYDNTEFFNFLTEEGPSLPQWEGSPLYHGRITVWCG